MNEKIKALWMRTISGTMCRLPCKECKEVLGDNFDGCPNHADVSKDETYAFIKKVTDFLCARLKREDDLPFPVDLSEDDIVNMIMEAANE